MKILELKNLEKSYNGNTVVNKINLSIDQGIIYGLLGPNGAGKSTTINMITGLITPNDGEIIYEENEKKISNWKRNIGLVPQDFALYWDLTAEENVRFFCSLYGFKGNDLKEIVTKALEFVGLVDVRKKRVSIFSGGMKRRLNIACAIAHSPKLIIMDEPTVGIDPQSRNHILESVKKLKESNSTVIYTSHYMEEVDEICDTIAIIDHGNVIATGSSEELKKTHASKDIYTIELNDDASKVESLVKNIKGVYKVKSNGNTLKCYYENNKKIIEDLVTKITEEDFIITNIKSEVPSLETVFLELTGKSLRD